MEKQSLIDQIVLVENMIAEYDNCDNNEFTNRISGLESMSIPGLKKRFKWRNLVLEDEILKSYKK